MKTTRSILLTSTIVAGLSAAATMAWAQPETPPPPPPPPEDQAQPTAGGTEVEGLVITGSRIRRNEFTSPAPVQVITAETSTLEGLADATEILQTSSVAAGSTQINNIFTGFVINGGPGVNTISLRGLGDNRTLVMLNGRRLPPAGVQGSVAAVDLNILPDSVIERYEVLKDGASSIYGSDAIAGVVNALTRRTLDGGLVEVDGIFAEHQGGSEYSISGAYGRVLDRGHFQISGQWYRRDALLKGDREELDCQHTYSTDLNGVRNDWVDRDTGVFKCSDFGGNIAGYVPVLFPDGSLYGSRVPIEVEGPGYPANPPFWPASNPDGNLPPGWRFIPLNERDFNPALTRDTTVINPVDRYTLFADGAYDVGFGEIYGELLLHRRESDSKGWQTIFHSVSNEAPCSVNPFNCGTAVLDDFFGAQTLLLFPSEYNVDINLYRGVAGLRGKFGTSFLSGWEWDGYISYSASRGSYQTSGIYQDRIEAVTGTDVNFNFIGVCPPGSATGCVPMNFFTNDQLRLETFTPEQLNYLAFTETGHTDYDQFIGEFQINGNIIDLPAGPLGAAFGVVYRHDELDDRPGPQAVAQNYWGRATAGRTQGSDSVWELYGELEAPILRGSPIAEALTLNLSGRYSHYESYGDSTTYKVGVNWQIRDWIRLRGTYGTSFRAPALFEQFLNNQTAFLGQSSVDPCINWGDSSNQTLRENCEADGLPPNFTGVGSSALILIGGGSDLQAETSKARTVGLILTPHFLDINVAVDYYEIEVKNQVVSLAGSVVGRCYTSPTFPTDPFCDLFERDPDTGSILFVDASYRNIVSQTNRGIDLTIRFSQDIGPGKLTVDAQGTWTLEDTQELFPGAIDDFNGVIGEPDFVASGQARYKYHDFTFTWGADFVGQQSNYGYQFDNNLSLSNLVSPAGGIRVAKNHVEPTWYHHFSIKYEGATWSATAGVRNLFDERPPMASDPTSPDKGNFTYGRVGDYVFASQYDYVGRRFFVNVTKRF
jgi:iron complex outermembrane receptor protein